MNAQVLRHRRHHGAEEKNNAGEKECDEGAGRREEANQKHWRSRNKWWRRGIPVVRARRVLSGTPGTLSERKLANGDGTQLRTTGLREADLCAERGEGSMAFPYSCSPAREEEKSSEKGTQIPVPPSWEDSVQMNWTGG